jgi:hypothetical protein
MFFARSLFIASAIGGTLAQISGFNISSQCQSTVLAVAANPGAACLNPSGLLQVFVQGSSTSVVGPIDTWLRGLCALPPCSNDNIASIVTNITTGCASDLQPVLGDIQPSSLVPIVQQVYPTVRRAVCLADASDNNRICVAQTLSNVETVTGTLTIDKLAGVISALKDGQTESLNGVNLCTACNKQIYNVAKTDFPEIFGQGEIASDAQTSCGASFVDGASDPNIVQTATNNTTPANSASDTSGSVQVTGQQALLSTFLLGLLALTA